MAHRNSYMNFVKHYDLIREVLRQYYIVGLCSKTAQKSQRDYNNKIRRVRNFINDEFLKHDNINKIQQILCWKLHKGTQFFVWLLSYKKCRC